MFRIAAPPRRLHAIRGVRVIQPVYVVLVMATIVWGTGHTAGKIALRDLEPQQITLIRPALAWIVLAAISLASGRAGLAIRQLRETPGTLFTLGLLGYAGAGGLTVATLSFMPAGVTSLLTNTSPLMLVLGTIPFYRRLPRRSVLAGALVGFMGVAVLSLGSSSVSPASNPWLGVPLALASAACWAGYTALARRLAGRDPIATTTVTSGLGMLVLAVVAIPTSDWSRLATASTAALMAVAWYGAVTMGLTYAAWSYALRHLPAPVVAPFVYLIPAFSLLTASIVLGEPLTPTLVVGAALVLSGVALTQRRP